MVRSTRSRARQGGDDTEPPTKVRSSKPLYGTFEHTSSLVLPVCRVYKGSDHRGSGQ